LQDFSDRLRKFVEASKKIPANCQWATFLRNHDEIELITLPEEDREPLRAWLDPHKQYPFRKGETTAMRIASIFRGDTDKILQAFKLLYTMPGAPVMYYGDELGMENVHNIAFILDTRRHVRGEFDWALAERQMADPQSLWSKVAALIKDRSTHSPDAILAK
jgi:maltose alpha-D-glucosyltransferase/alpha-amylase